MNFPATRLTLGLTIASLFAYGCGPTPPDLGVTQAGGSGGPDESEFDEPDESEESDETDESEYDGTESLDGEPCIDSSDCRHDGVIQWPHACLDIDYATDRGICADARTYGLEITINVRTFMDACGDVPTVTLVDGSEARGHSPSHHDVCQAQGSWPAVATSSTRLALVRGWAERSVRLVVEAEGGQFKDVLELPGLARPEAFLASTTRPIEIASHREHPSDDLIQDIHVYARLAAIGEP